MGKSPPKKKQELTQRNIHTAEDKERRKELFLSAFRESYTITSAALKIGVTRQTVWNWAKEDPDFQQKILDIREEKIEQVEDLMWEAITQKKSEEMIRFFLRTQARHKGFANTENIEQIAKLPSKVQVTVIRAKAVDDNPDE